MTALAERLLGFTAPIGRFRSEAVRTIHARTGDAPLSTRKDPSHSHEMLITSAALHRAIRQTVNDETVLARFAVSLRAENASENTIQLRTQTVRKAARDAGCSVLMLTADQIRTFLAAYANKNTRNTYYRSLKAFCRWAIAEGLRDEDPMTNIRTPPVPRRIPRPCSTPALDAMLEVATARERAMLLLAAHLGLRAGEIAMTRGEHFDLDLGVIRVLGKGGVEAVLPLSQEIVELVAAMPTTGWWFPSKTRRGDHIQAQWVCQIVRAVCKRAGVPLHGAHPLRHWFGTHLVRNGCDLRTAQELMRHASLATTAGYVEVSDQARRDAVHRLPRLGIPMQDRAGTGRTVLHPASGYPVPAPGADVLPSWTGSGSVSASAPNGPGGGGGGSTSPAPAACPSG